MLLSTCPQAGDFFLKVFQILQTSLVIFFHIAIWQWNDILKGIAHILNVNELCYHYPSRGYNINLFEIYRVLWGSWVHLYDD